MTQKDSNYNLTLRTFNNAVFAFTLL